MSSPARASWPDVEARFLENLRTRYESQGFQFIVRPDRSELPAFLTKYQPDAIARKPGHNVAIEVKRQSSPKGRQSLQDIRRLFEGHPDWRFSVAYAGTEDFASVVIPAATTEAILRRVEEARTLCAQGHCQPALVMAWSLLEASLQSLDEEMERRPRTPGTVVQTLAMNGYISSETERQARDLIPVRNSIVHGDVAIEPTAHDVELLLGIVEDILRRKK